METDKQSFRTKPTSGSSASGSERDSRTQSITDQANQAMSKLTEAAQQAGSQAKEAVTSLSSQATSTVKDALNQQVNAGADLASHVAESVKRAADNLDQNVPQLAGLARGAAEKIEALSTEARNKSVDELFQNASDFARRQPALVFGAAAVFGFALFRVLKAGASNEPQRGLQGSGSGRGRWPPAGQPENRWQNCQGSESFRPLSGANSASSRATPGGGPYGT
jgi:ABC-type transporter Mla subunit MlaD